jgi:hypothetical protein
MAKIDFSADYDGRRLAEDPPSSVDKLLSSICIHLTVPNLLLLGAISMSVSNSTHRAMANPPIPATLIVSLVAPPWAMAIVALHSGTKLLEQLGVASEEIFRGDRLPVLHFPDRTN